MAGGPPIGAPSALDPARARLHRAARRHTRLVRALRRAIPLGAATATAFVAAAWLNPFATIGAGVTLGPVSVQGTKITMDRPKLSGFRKDDRRYDVTAEAAFQDVRKPFVIELQTLRGHAVMDDKGALAHLEAATGVFDTQKETLELRRDIRLRTDARQEARLASASIDLKAGTMRSSEPVTVTFPQGSIEAATLEVGQGGKTIAFVGNVHAVFTREEAEGGPVQEAATQGAPTKEAAAQPTDGAR